MSIRILDFQSMRAWKPLFNIEAMKNQKTLHTTQQPLWMTSDLSFVYHCTGQSPALSLYIQAGLLICLRASLLLYASFQHLAVLYINVKCSERQLRLSVTILRWQTSHSRLISLVCILYRCVENEWLTLRMSLKTILEVLSPMSKPLQYDLIKLTDLTLLKRRNVL